MRPERQRHIADPSQGTLSPRFLNRWRGLAFWVVPTTQIYNLTLRGAQRLRPPPTNPGASDDSGH